MERFLFLKVLFGWSFKPPTQSQRVYVFALAERICTGLSHFHATTMTYWPAVSISYRAIEGCCGVLRCPLPKWIVLLRLCLFLTIQLRACESIGCKGEQLKQVFTENFRRVAETAVNRKFAIVTQGCTVGDAPSLFCGKKLVKLHWSRNRNATFETIYIFNLDKNGTNINIF